MGIIDRLFRRKHAHLTDDAIAELSSAITIEDAASTCLEWVNTELAPWVSYAYVWSKEDRHYRLVATLTASSSAMAEPEPNYSGLMSSGPTGLSAPLALPASSAPPTPEIQHVGAEWWLVVPCGGVCLIRVRYEHGGDLQPTYLDAVTEYARMAGPVMVALQRTADALAEVERLESSLSASQLAAQAMLQPYRILEMLFRLPLGILGAAHGCLIVSGGDSNSAEVIAVHGRGAELGAILLRGDIPYLLDLPLEPDLIQGPELGVLMDHGVAAVVRISALHSGASQGCAYYFFDQVLEIDPYQMTVLTTLGDRFAQEVASAHLITEMSDRYLLTLRSLINALDSLTPYTVGHSDRLARYARLIGNEKGLPPNQVEAIALAAYLHDVGMIALDVDVLSNGDRWSPEQYELMKQHAILGGQLVSTVQAEVPITPSVQHHHERWDGYGYPYRLRGEEIPLGARVIAVCDIFDAKTTSRPGRQALPFARALQDMQVMAGSQLDPDLVAAFVRGIKRLGDRAAIDQPVERCWVVRQVSADVCGDCRNRVHKTAHACWDDPANLCSHHGDVCATCMVYTEVLTRATGGEVL